jgi:hypothetical protein
VYKNFVEAGVDQMDEDEKRSHDCGEGNADAP